MALDTGEMLQNRYRVVSPLGHGGMGAIYQAWDTRLDVPVALKEMLPQPEIDALTLAQLRQQFQQEAKVLARLNHPHLVRVSDSFEENGNAYLVMDFVEGESLADRLEREGALPEDQVLEWATQLLDALGYCHSQGVIHRDVKPHNVIIRPDGQAMLVDFGLVKLWDPGDPRTRTVMQGLGTPEYAPPEQYDIGSGHTDPRSDIYSLGATLYHSLTGQPPPTATQRMVNPRVLKAPKMLNPRLSARAERVILRAVEPQPDHRFQSAQEMAVALGDKAPASAFLVPSKSQPTKVISGAPPVASARLRRVPVWVLVLGGLAVAVGGGALLWGMNQPEGRIAVASPAIPTATSTATPSPTSTSTPTPTPMSTPTRTSTPLQGALPTPRGGGGRIAFVSSRDGNEEIYVMNVDGSGQTNLTDHPATDSIPAWSPDGERILFESNRDGNWEIYVMNADGSGVTRLTTSSADERDPDWSPDGKHIVFHSDQSGYWGVWVMNLEGGEPTPLTVNPAGDWAASWSPDGKTIAFASRRDAPGEGEIYVMNADGDNQVNLTNNSVPESVPHWSPDGTRILFYSERDGNKEVYVMKADGSGETRLTDHPADDWLGTWSPDGKLIAFTSDRDGNREVYVMQADGSDLACLTNSSGDDWNPAWSPK